MSERSVPYALSGLGALLCAVMLGGFAYVAVVRGTLDAVALVTHASSLPFAALLVYGGHWLSHSGVSSDRYRRIGLWVAASTAFLLAIFAVIAFATQHDWVVRIAILGWAASIGGGAGFLIGAFEARAIERAVAAERVRVRNEELRRQNERLDELAGVISHDLRNPLTVARGYVDLLRGHDGDYEDDERLAAVERALERMDRIVQETLTLARSGRVIDDPEPVDLGECARRCWTNVPTESATLDVASSTVVIADPSRLEHLFENLFRNALEHGSTGSRSESDDALEHGGAVTVRVGALEDGFYVADDGRGIPESERDDVFDPGYTTTEGGSGFGLAIVEQIVDAHGWDIRLVEADSGGARFEVTGVETRPSLRTAIANVDVTRAGAG